VERVTSSVDEKAPLDLFIHAFDYDFRRERAYQGAVRARGVRYSRSSNFSKAQEFFRLVHKLYDWSPEGGHRRDVLQHHRNIAEHLVVFGLDCRELATRQQRAIVSVLPHLVHRDTLSIFYTAPFGICSVNRAVCAICIMNVSERSDLK
jgi:hypothetical protein